MSTKFMWLRDENKKPIAVVATVLEKAEDGQTAVVTYSLATHNPKDTFDKHVGRTIATNRILIGRHTNSIVIREGENVKKNLMADILNRNNLPQRTKEAIQYWMGQQSK